MAGLDGQDMTIADGPDPEALALRVDLLIATVNSFAFNYVRRGLFDRHKLIVASLLAFQRSIKYGTLDPVLFQHMLGSVKLAASATDGARVPDMLADWLHDDIYAGKNHPFLLFSLRTIPSSFSLCLP